MVPRLGVTAANPDSQQTLGAKGLPLALEPVLWAVGIGVGRLEERFEGFVCHYCFLYFF